ncbi:unnamed protein product, partial [marine sediment metagenome]
MKECVILEHPFFDDYMIAFQSAAFKEVDPQSREKIRKLMCELLPSKYLKMRWEGWQMGIRRPPESFPKEWLEQRSLDIALFLADFFKRVESGSLYCDFAVVVERFGEEMVTNRMSKKTGLHLNLERVYWTFNVKFRRWIHSNIRLYDCSLICELDEILATADSELREAFFPTIVPEAIPELRELLGDELPNFHFIGPQKRKE